MEKKRVSVQIEGRSYSLITTDDEKYVQKVANEAKKTEQELRNEKLLGYVPMTQFSLFDEDKK